MTTLSHPLLDRLTGDLGWPLIETVEALTAFTATPGTHVVFLPGDPARNPETADVAVILPELRTAFQGRFDCALGTGDAVTGAVGEAAGGYKTPNLVFYRDGRVIGAIPKVRDWSDYMDRIGHILAAPMAAE